MVSHALRRYETVPPLSLPAAVQSGTIPPLRGAPGTRRVDAAGAAAAAAPVEAAALLFWRWRREGRLSAAPAVPGSMVLRFFFCVPAFFGSSGAFGGAQQRSRTLAFAQQRGNAVMLRQASARRLRNRAGGRHAAGARA